MKIQTGAVNILERTSSFLKAGLLTKVPAWYDIVSRVPPTKRFTRDPKLTNPSNDEYLGELKEFDMHIDEGLKIYKTRASNKDKEVATSSMYKAPLLEYAEDRLRDLFYHQHPWELSRPKILVENNVDECYDWSHIQQLNKSLDGESVVQRTLYLLKSKAQNNLIKAYDQARFEFYRLRIEQEVLEQVSQEEAEMFGSVFGTTAIEFGIQKEQSVIDTWKKKALQQAELSMAKKSNPSSSWETEENDGNNNKHQDDVEELKL